MRASASSPRRTSARRRSATGRSLACACASASSASSRITVSIVPSTGRARRGTPRRSPSGTPARASASRSSSHPPSTSAKPRTICDRITPELPRAPISAARAISCASRSRSCSSSCLERLDDRAHRQRQVRARVAVRDRVDVQVVDPPAARLDRGGRRARRAGGRRRGRSCGLASPPRCGPRRRRSAELRHPPDLVRDAGAHGRGDLGEVRARARRRRGRRSSGPARSPETSIPAVGPGAGEQPADPVRWRTCRRRRSTRRRSGRRSARSRRLRSRRGRGRTRRGRTPRRELRPERALAVTEAFWTLPPLRQRVQT